jgi:Holliday junction resolvase RusA-like endonuclease
VGYGVIDFDGFVPVRGKPKARPRVTKNGTFMPADYRKWRDEFAVELARLKPPAYQGPVALRLDFQTDGVRIHMDAFDGVRPKHVRADLDNLVGAVMEVLEDAGVVGNDRQIMFLEASCYEDGDDGAT